MASFNQVPAGQASLPYVSNLISVIGTDTDNATLIFDQVKYGMSAFDSRHLELTIEPSVTPASRRPSKRVTGVI